MVVVGCSVPGCEFKSDDVSEAMSIAILTNHGLAHQAAPPAIAGPAPVPRSPKLERRKVDVGVTTEEWNVFVRRWDVFRAWSGIDEASAPSQLFQCTGTEFGDSLLKVNPNPTSDSLTQLLTAMRSLAIIPVATGVLRTELLQLRQERDLNLPDIRSEVFDPDICREILGTVKILKIPANEVIALVENKEMAQNALPSSSETSTVPRPQEPLPPVHGRYSGWNSKPHPVCIECCRSTARAPGPWSLPTVQAVEADAISQVAALQVDEPCPRQQRRRRLRGRTKAARGTISKLSPVIVDHQVFTAAEWKRARLRAHPRIAITVNMDISEHAKYGSPTPSSNADAEISAITDTGAQSRVIRGVACFFSNVRTELRAPK
ncbi:hypothetical protein QZH41_010696, partial [Actinostola sp. cb2023]